MYLVYFLFSLVFKKDSYPGQLAQKLIITWRTNYNLTKLSSKDKDSKRMNYYYYLMIKDEDPKKTKYYYNLPKKDKDSKKRN